MDQYIVLNKLKLGGRFLLKISTAVFQQFIKNRALSVAGGLAYTTLLGVVPLLVVGFAIFAALPQFDSLAANFKNVIFSHFIPTSGEVVEGYLFYFVEQTSNLSTVSTVILVVTAFLLMHSVDSAINTLWHNNEKRKIIVSLLIYCLVLVFGPMLIGVSIAVTSFVFSLPFITDAADIVGGTVYLLEYLPFALTTLSLWVIYIVLPKGYVSNKYAFISSIVAALLFEFSKQIFVWSITTFPTYQVIYGAFAVIPIFLVWVYLSWLIILLGAQMTSCLQFFEDHQEMQKK